MKLNIEKLDLTDMEREGLSVGDISMLTKALESSSTLVEVGHVLELFCQKVGVSPAQIGRILLTIIRKKQN